MRFFTQVSLAGALTQVSLALANVYPAGSPGYHINQDITKPALPKIPLPSTGPAKNGVPLPPYDTIYYFDQLIDHNKPSLGTFKQRYYFNSEFYKPGGAIILGTPGESALDGFSGYVTTGSLNGLIGKATNGAVIFLESRFFGLSNPLPTLTEEALALHTLEQALADYANFARNAVLPMPGGDKVGGTIPKALWTFIGGSYPGALVSWVLTSYPDVFYSGYSSSGVVQAVPYYWGYFEPVRNYMPANCSADVQQVVTYMDKVFTTGTAAQKLALKTQFGLKDVTHDDDAASSLRYELFKWQSLSPATGPNGEFYQFCDALEVKNGVKASSAGWGLTYALSAWGAYHTKFVNNLCGGATQVGACLNSYVKTYSYYTNPTINNASRSWMWLLCKYFGYWQGGAPINWPTIVSRLSNPDHDNRVCSNWFPKTYPKGFATPDAAYVNSKWGGWDRTPARIVFANGNRDPWIEASVSSHFRTGERTQIIGLSNGFHCSDLVTYFGDYDVTVKRVQDFGVATMGIWYNEWVKTHKVVKRSEVEGDWDIIERDASELEKRDDGETPEEQIAKLQAALEATYDFINTTSKGKTGEFSKLSASVISAGPANFTLEDIDDSKAEIHESDKHVVGNAWFMGTDN